MRTAMIDHICDYDEAYSKADAREMGFCTTCRISSCKNNRRYNGNGVKNPMNMTPNDYATIIQRKDAEILRLKKIVADVTENIKTVGKQNTRLKRRCDRYEKRLTELYLNGAFK